MCSIVTAFSDLQQMFMSSANINTATDGTVVKIKNYSDFYIIHSHFQDVMINVYD